MVDSGIAAAALGITEAGVRKLRQRGRLRNYGTKRKAMHLWSEVAALVPGLTPKKSEQFSETA